MNGQEAFELYDLTVGDTVQAVCESEGNLWDDLTTVEQLVWDTYAQRLENQEHRHIVDWRYEPVTCRVFQFISHVTVTQRPLMIIQARNGYRRTVHAGAWASWERALPPLLVG